MLTSYSMENFITGYPGHESSIRAAMLQVMGQKNYDYFFDRWLYYFFTEADAKFFKSLGLNCIRIIEERRRSDFNKQLPTQQES
jgi:hypothetical protein